MTYREVKSQQEARGLDALRVNPSAVAEADLIVGIPSYNKADNIAFVVEKCNAGLRKYFPHLKSVIINVDNNSPDDTRNAFLNAVNHVPKLYISTPGGVKGKGNNFYNLFREAVRLKAKAVVVVDADITSITPEWVLDLARPILNEGYDFASPLYSRNEYDGTITNNICYPLIYGILGKDIRQPIGGDFAFSGKLANYYLQQPWQETTFQYGIDIFMTLNAIVGGFRLCQVSLGAKIHKPSAPKLGPMFTQVVDTLFKSLLACKDQWLTFSRVQRLERFGKAELAAPQSLSIDYKSLKATALKEFSANSEVLRRHLPPEMYGRLKSMYESQKINIGMDFWTRLVYEMLYKFYRFEGEIEIVEAMKSLYFGRVVTFIRQTLDFDYEPSEAQIVRQARYFFRKRNYLVQKFC